MHPQSNIRESHTRLTHLGTEEIFTLALHNQKIRSLGESIRTAHSPFALYRHTHNMASTQQTPPTLRLDPATKSPTSVLLPLAISLHLASSLAQPIPIEWHEKLPQSVALITEQGQEVKGVEAVSKSLVNSYAHLGIGGKDNSNSQQVRHDDKASLARGLSAH